MLGKEALVLLTDLSLLVTTKLEEPLSHVRWLGQRPDCNRDHEVILPHDLLRFPPQSPAVPVNGLGTSIGPRLGTIIRAPE